MSTRRKREDGWAYKFETMLDENPKFFFFLLGVGYSGFFILGLILGVVLG